MKLLIQSLSIGAAGFLGAVSRFLVAKGCAWAFGTAFPVGTMVINVSGSFFLAWFTTLVADRFAVSETFRLAVGVGFVGAYTTFSTLMWESNKLLEDGAEIKGAMNLVLSLALGLLAIKAGIVMARRA